MLHKTLDSYYKNEPYQNEQDHPDGDLWLITREELNDLPKGVKLESVRGNKVVVGKDAIDLSEDEGYLPYGLRGRRE